VLGDVGQVTGLERVLVHLLHHLAGLRHVVFLLLLLTAILVFAVAVVLTRGSLCC
jgi:hypothetical protein